MSGFWAWLTHTFVAAKPILWRRPDAFVIYWAAWIGMFLAAEIPAAIWKPAWTLSEETWGLEHLDTAHPFDVAAWTPVHWVIALTVWGLFAWLSLHLPFGVK